MLFLSYRARSESEIRKNLRKHEIPEPVLRKLGQFVQSHLGR